MFDNHSSQSFSRRQMLQNCSVGFGAMALAALMADSAGAAVSRGLQTGGILKNHHYRPRAKHVIFCYMSGGVSHIDSFDPKPLLTKMHGQPMPMKVERTMFNNNGNIMGSPFEFTPSGKSGIPVSSMFPHIAKVVDELAIIRSMTSSVNEHAQGNFFMHTGFPIMGYPSAGAWATYGLGTENRDLPGYVVLQSGGAVPAHGGVSLYSNGFLPAQHQGSIIVADQQEAIHNIRPRDEKRIQRRRLDLVKKFDDPFLTDTGADAQVEAAIENYETAFRMQMAVPEACDISGESEATKKLYGLDSTVPQKAAYARQCLLARRLVERGVRFIELSCLTHGIGAGACAQSVGSARRIAKRPRRHGQPGRSTHRSTHSGFAQSRLA